MKTTNVNFSDEQVQELLEYYQISLKRLEAKRDDILNIISQLKNQNTNPIVTIGDGSGDGTDFHKDWSWSEKARYILRRKQKCYTTKEILKWIAFYQPELLANKQFWQESYQTLSGTISTKVKEKKIFDRYKPISGGEYKIGLVEWFLSGEPLAEFRND